MIPIEHEDEAGAERHVPQPVDLGRRARPSFLELHVGDDGADDAERHRDQEDEVPLDGASTPPRTSPTNEPAIAAVLLMPSPRPR